jgi:hypothetical protein
LGAAVVEGAAGPANATDKELVDDNAGQSRRVPRSHPVDRFRSQGFYDDSTNLGRVRCDRHSTGAVRIQDVERLPVGEIASRVGCDRAGVRHRIAYV